MTNLPLLAIFFPVAAALLSAGSLPVLASEFIPLGGPPAEVFPIDAQGLDAAGTIVAGTGVGEACVWTAANGSQPIPATNGFVQAVSADGGSVVGGVFNEATKVTEPFLWTESGGLQRLGFPSGALLPVQAVAEGVSGNGGVVAGYTSFGGSRQAFRWEASEGFTNLTPDSADESFAYAVSDDASVVVGASDSTAFRWSQSGGLVDLGSLPGGRGGSTAFDISADNAVIVGSSSSGSSAVEAFRWTAETGMVGLGFLSSVNSTTVANATTGRGEAVIGRNDTFGAAPGVAAFLWTEGFGIESLQGVLSGRLGLGSQLNGWQLASATDISPDGRSIVGYGINPSGNAEGWLVRLDRPVFVPEPNSLALIAFLVSLAPSRRRAR